MNESTEHVIKSKQAKDFFKRLGVKIDKSSAHNMVKLVDKEGNELLLWAESESSVAAGIPGIYVYEK